MRFLQTTLALTVCALAFPAAAEAKGGKWHDGGGKGGGHRGGTSRAASIFGSDSRPSPRATPAPSASRSSRSETLSTPFTRAPRSTTRAASIHPAEGWTAPAAGRSRGSRDSTPSIGGTGGGLFGRRGGTERAPASGLDGGRTVSRRGQGAKERAAASTGTAAEPVRAGAIVGNPDFHRVGSVGNGNGPEIKERSGRRSGVPGFPNHGGGSSTGGSGTVGGGGSVGVPAPGYGTGWRNGYRVGYRHGWTDNNRAHHWGSHGHYGYHDFYDHNHWYLSFSFGAGCGPYSGVSYYHPFRSWTLGVDYAFFYPQPVSYCYVPYGFYSVYEPVYVTRHTTVVRETVPVYTYETRTVYTVEEIEEMEAKGVAGPVAGTVDENAPVATADPKPVAGSPATEKLLREASTLFHGKDYYEAAVKFRLAALSSPGLPGPLFALGQSLMAMGQDAYAARVLRKAVIANPNLLDETADLVGVYADQGEFDRVMAELESRAKAAPADGDARFLLAYQMYFTGDPRCREEFDALHAAAPKDEAVELFRAAVERRFKAQADLPEIKK